MEIIPEQFWRLFAESLFLGFTLGTVYCILSSARILLCTGKQTSLRLSISKCSFPWIRNPFMFREKSQRSSWFRFMLPILFDVAFCIFAAVGTILLAFVGNHGRIRWFIPLGICIGFTVTRALLTNATTILLDCLLVVCKIVLSYLLFLLVLPIKLLIRIGTSVIRRLLVCTGNRLRNHTEQIFRKKRIPELKALALKGFGCLEAYEKPSEEACKTTTKITK